VTVREQVSAARAAAYRLSGLSTGVKNTALLAAARLLRARSNDVFDANQVDQQAARKQELAQPLFKRLAISEGKLEKMAQSLESVASLPDPVGEILTRRELDEGLVLEQVRVPIGVIGVIFESRPDALLQIGSLAIKSGNSVILKGGKEAVGTNRVLHEILADSLHSVSAEFDGATQLVETHEQIATMLSLDGEIDLMIPRGSNELVRHIQENTRIPVLGHSDGICHLYIDADADPEMAVKVTVDAKMQYPAVCNAIETLLVHVEATSLLPAIHGALPGVELRGCERTRAIIDVAAATEEDWRTEYNDLVLSIRIVDSLDEAIRHINTFGSHHSDAIITSSKAAADRFLGEVDSAAVLWNASTRFVDGFVFGLGAEVGISTGKVHARGPVGLTGLTTTQYRVRGHGHVILDYAEGQRAYTHRELL
jgi:glutamate-5-semialdehyde dehydrogenase